MSWILGRDGDLQKVVLRSRPISSTTTLAARITSPLWHITCPSQHLTLSNEHANSYHAIFMWKKQYSNNTFNFVNKNCIWAATFYTQLLNISVSAKSNSFIKGNFKTFLYVGQAGHLYFFTMQNDWCMCSSGHFEALTHGAALQWATICISFHVGDIRLMACDWCDEY